MSTSEHQYIATFDNTPLHLAPPAFESAVIAARAALQAAKAAEYAADAAPQRAARAALDWDEAARAALITGGPTPSRDRLTAAQRLAAQGPGSAWPAMREASAAVSVVSEMFPTIQAEWLASCDAAMGAQKQILADHSQAVTAAFETLASIHHVIKKFSTDNGTGGTGGYTMPNIEADFREAISSTPWTANPEAPPAVITARGMSYINPLRTNVVRAAR